MCVVVLRMTARGSATVCVAYFPWPCATGGCVTRSGQFNRLAVAGAGGYRVTSAYGPAAPPRC